MALRFKRGTNFFWMEIGYKTNIPKLCQLKLIGRIDSGVDMTAVGQGSLGQGGASNQESTRYFNYLGLDLVDFLLIFL